jgi:hypothetical protein
MDICNTFTLYYCQDSREEPFVQNISIARGEWPKLPIQVSPFKNAGKSQTEFATTVVLESGRPVSWTLKISPLNK